MMRRGLSLIEVLIATAILAATAAACAPPLVASMRALHDGEQHLGAGELGLLADEVLAVPQAFGIEAHHLRERAALEVRFPDRPELGPVLMTVVPSAEEGAAHAWLVFTFEAGDERHIACRWVRLPDAEEDEP